MCAKHNEGITSDIGDDGQPLNNATQQKYGKRTGKACNIKHRPRAAVSVAVKVVLAHVQVVQHHEQNDSRADCPPPGNPLLQHIQSPVQDKTRPQEWHTG